MIVGYVEHVLSHTVSGWVTNTQTPGQRLRVRLLHDGHPIADTQTSIRREDVAQHYALPSDADVAFGFAFFPPPGLDLDSLSVEVETEDAWTPLRRLEGPPQRYQSFAGDGSSDSPAKLAALQLEELVRQPGLPPLHGQRMLDLGCNEGFFCRAAIDQGAARVLGVDRSRHFIEAARRQVPQAEFLEASWWDVRSGPFDVILLLSAIHYEPRQRELLRHLSTLLAPGGTLILECGMWEHTPRQGWQVVNRHDGHKRYPTRSHLQDTLLSDYAWRYIGRSVSQAGDPVERHVYHCRRRKPAVVLVHGDGGIGKTTVARAIGRDQNVYSTDELLYQLFHYARYAGLRIREVVAKSLTDSPPTTALGMFDEVTRLGLVEAFAQLLIEELPLDLDVTIVEGQALTDPVLRGHLIRHLKDKGVDCWAMTSADPAP
jgi:SAM-dependent methyltransferase